MNNPEYILVDVFAEIVSAVKAEILSGPNAATILPQGELNYQYGYITELEQTMQQWGLLDEYESKKFPCVWLKQPFTIIRGSNNAFFGEVEGGADVFILVNTDKNLKAAGRMAYKFKPVIYPIYRELLNQINIHVAISDEYDRAHKFTDRYYWGPEQQQQLSDSVDCSQISNLSLKINHNPNCSPTFNLI